MLDGFEKGQRYRRFALHLGLAVQILSGPTPRLKLLLKLTNVEATLINERIDRVLRRRKKRGVWPVAVVRNIKKPRGVKLNPWRANNLKSVIEDDDDVPDVVVMESPSAAVAEDGSTKG